jgi:hypothetical protein
MMASETLAFSPGDCAFQTNGIPACGRDDREQCQLRGMETPSRRG